MVPWKYGFKSIKSIVKIRFVETSRTTTWKAAAGVLRLLREREPGATTRSSAIRPTERRLGEFFMRKTLLFNGYGDQVASFYTGIDLEKNV